MALYSKDRESLVRSADMLSQLILGDKHKRAQMEQQAGIDSESAAQKAQLDSDSQAESIRRAMELRGQLPAGADVNVGGVGLRSPDPVMRNLAMMERMDRRNDQDLVKLGERVEKKNLPSAMSALANLERGTADPEKGQGILDDAGYEVKSAGPVANFLPQFVKNAGESVGLMPEGSSKEAALIQRLVNADIKELSGTAVSDYETGRQNVEKGMSGFGEPNLIKLGIKQMQDALQSSARNIESSSRPEVVNTFRQQGGKITLEDYLGKGQKAPMSFEEFKKKKREGKL